TQILSREGVQTQTPPAEIFCIWQQALPRCQPHRASRGRKPIRRGRCALSPPRLLVAEKRLTDLGAAVFADSPADFGKFIADEIDKWRKVVRFAGIKAE